MNPSLHAYVYVIVFLQNVVSRKSIADEPTSCDKVSRKSVSRDTGERESVCLEIKQEIRSVERGVCLIAL